MAEINKNSPKETIKRLQEDLIKLEVLMPTYTNSRGEEKSSVDGIYGNDTTDAVAQYQIIKGLPETGIADIVTQGAMERELNPPEPPPDPPPPPVPTEAIRKLQRNLGKLGDGAKSAPQLLGDPSLANMIGAVAPTGIMDDATSIALFFLKKALNLSVDTHFLGVDDSTQSSSITAKKLYEERMFNSYLMAVSKELSPDFPLYFSSIFGSTFNTKAAANKFNTSLGEVPGGVESLSYVVLNPIMKESDLVPEVLFGPASKFYNLTGDAAGALDAAETMPFQRYFSKRMVKIKELFKFFQNRLKKDLEAKKKPIKKNGIDFQKHIAMMDKTNSSVEKAIRAAHPDFSELIESSTFINNKYQLVIVCEGTTFLGTFIYFAGPKTTETGDVLYSLQNSVLRLWVDRKYFTTESPKKNEEDAATRDNEGERLNSQIASNPFVDRIGLRYLMDLKTIEPLAGADLHRAAGVLDCGVANLVSEQNVPKLLEYINFSTRYHKPFPIEETSMTKEELSLWRSQNPTNVGSTLGLWDAVSQGFGEAVLSLVSDTYVVQEKDAFYLEPPSNDAGLKEYPFGYEEVRESTGGAYVTVYKPSPLSARMEKIAGSWAERRKLFLNINGADNKVDDLRDRIPEWKKRAKKSKTGNVLIVGEEINLPRPTPPNGFKKESWKDLVDSFNIDDAGTKTLQKIWYEELYQPLLVKICPATLPWRTMECLLPTDCRELIRYIGLWRTRDYIENFVLLDMFDDVGGIEAALTKWDELVESRYNFKSVRFDAHGFLTTGTFKTSDMFPMPITDISVSMQVRMNDAEGFAAANKGRKKYFLTMGESSSSGTFAGGSFAVAKSSSGDIEVEVYSTEEQKATYTTKGSGFKIDSDTLWHQLGFQFSAATGDVTVYVDGRKIATELTQDSERAFLLPLGSPDSCRVTVASKNYKKPTQSIAADIDEIVFFDRTLSPEEWKKISVINSDSNLATIGMNNDAKAWWRMGDCVDDFLGNTDADVNTPEGKIVDKIAGVNLTPPQNAYYKNAQIIVSRLFEEKDYPRFVDIINRETDIVKVCDSIVKYIRSLLETEFDPDKLKRDILQKFKFPTFSKDPHAQIEVLLKKVVVDNLIRLVMKFLLRMLEKLLDCDGWKTMVQGMVNGAFQLDGSVMGEAFTKNNPLAKFATGVGDPDAWEKFFDEDVEMLRQGFWDAAGNIVEIQETTTLRNGQTNTQTTATLGLSEPTMGDSHPAGATVHAAGGAIDSSIGVSGATGQNVVITAVKEASKNLPPDKLLSLFTTTADTATTLDVAGVLNEHASETGITFTESDVTTFFGAFGSALGLQGAIDQLSYMAQVVNENSKNPEFYCTSQQTLADRMGLNPTPASIEDDKNAVNDLLDAADEIMESSKDDASGCSPSIPMSSAERESLTRTINDVYASVLAAYDNDLVLHKLGLTSFSEEESLVKKVLWKGDSEDRKIFKDGKIIDETYEIEKTAINPEFEALLATGFIPRKKDGTVDGTKYGGVVKTDWWPFGGNFLGEIKPPTPLVPKPPETEDGEVEQPDIDFGDLHKSLGPYTDYTEAYAASKTPKISLTGRTSAALSKDSLGAVFGSDGDAIGEGASGYFSARDGFSARGIAGILSETKTSLLPPSRKVENATPIENSYSTITHTVEWGKSLQGIKYVSFSKEGADPMTFPDLAIPFQMNSDLEEAILATGFQPSSAECDEQQVSPTANFEAPLSEQFTPQEYVFEKIVNKNNDRLVISPEEIKKEVYDSLYVEVLQALFYKVADSPLLKTVPGTDLLGLNFLKINTTPGLLDMESFAKKVSEDYMSLMSCLDDVVEPPLYTALKTSAPRILARLCVIELVLRAIIPFSQLFYSKKDPMVKSLILEKLEVDLELFSKNPTDIKAKIVQQFNELAESGVVDADPIDVDSKTWDSTGYRTAMEFFIEDEFDVIANRIKEMVHGKCIPDTAENKETIKEEMYDNILKYAELDESKLNIETYAIFKETLSEPARKTKDFSVTEDYEEIETLGTSLSFMYNNKEVVLCSVEQSMDEFLKETQLNLEDLECPEEAYPRRGTTTGESGHSHSYIIRDDGSGATTETVGDVAPHTHAIAGYAVVPLIVEEEISHSHELVKNLNRYEIEEGFAIDSVQKHLRGKLTSTDSFKVLFDFCFNLNDASSLVMVYCLMAAENQIFAKSFSSTKKAIIDLFGWLWEEDSSTDPCATSEAAASTGLQFEDMFPDLANVANNPELILMLLLAPLLTYKGWVRTADPHVFTTATIMDLLEFPIMPKNQKKNVPVPWEDGKIECWDLPNFSQAVSPLDALAIGADNLWGPTGPWDMKKNAASTWFFQWPLLQGLVATGVTFAPMIFGLPPNIPSPFALIYYAPVSLLIWLLRDLPRLLGEMNETEEGVALLESIGMYAGPALNEETCSVNESLQAPSPTEEELAASDAEEAEEDCPPVKNFNETIIEAGKSADC